jgi:hypothetical protein
MVTITVSQADEGWSVDVDGAGHFQYTRLTDAVRRAGELSGGKSTTWIFSDDFLLEAVALAKDRVAVRSAQQRIANATTEMVNRLAMHGLENGDIATVLGISSTRVSQIIDPGQPLWGTDTGTADTHLVRLELEKGWRAGRGYGPMPSELSYAGQTFVPTGGAHSIGGQPPRHTFVRKSGS